MIGKYTSNLIYVSISYITVHRIQVMIIFFGMCL